MTTIVLQPFVELVSLGVSGWLLAQRRIRSNKTLFSLLLISALLVLAGLVLEIAPVGRSISGWIVD
jgi:hypothetical protein